MVTSIAFALSHMPFVTTKDFLTQISDALDMYTLNYRTGTWWTCLVLHAILEIFYFLWFVVGIVVSFWIEIPVDYFGRLVYTAVRLATSLSCTLFYIVLIGTTALIVLRRTSFFTSVQQRIIGALYLLCVYTLADYSSNLYYIGYRPESQFNSKMYIVQMNIGKAIAGFCLSIILNILAIILLSPDEESEIGAIYLLENCEE